MKFYVMAALFWFHAVCIRHY